MRITVGKAIATDCLNCQSPLECQFATLRGEDAETMSRQGINDFLDCEMPGSPGVKLRDFIPQQINTALAGNLAQMEYRTFLQPSVEFQASLRRDMAAGKFDRKVGQQLLLLDYPKYLWITEASSSALLNHPDKKDRKCVGRVIVDSTAPAKTKGAIALHVADFLQLINRNTGKIKTALYRNSTPFSHKFLS